LVRIISIVNQKGGVGKTTTAINLAACLAHSQQKTILIDLDPQGNASSGLGIDKHSVEKTIYDTLIDETPFADVLSPHAMDTLQIAPANSDLLSAEWQVGMDQDSKWILKRALSEYLWNETENKRPDYIVIDCPPSLGLLSLCAILSSDSLIIPVQCEYYALEGLTEILKSTTLLRQNFNSRLALDGILLTMSDKRLNLSRQVEDDIRQAYGKVVFNTVITRSVRLSEAPSHGLPIISYDPSSVGAVAYSELAQEVIDHEAKSSRSWPIRPSL
jgi:chromosome partitioning protein